jgi:hypothetical protein
MRAGLIIIYPHFEAKRRFHLSESKNIRNIIVKKMGNPDKMIAIRMLLIFMSLDCVFCCYIVARVGTVHFSSGCFGLIHL